MERRQVDLGLVDILEAVRASERNRGPRRSSAQPKHPRAAERSSGTMSGAGVKVKSAREEKMRKRKRRPGRRERAFRKGRG